MICEDPTTRRRSNPGVAFPCGYCLPCLINKRRDWTHRLMLEAKCHEDVSFLTCTYRDSDLPGAFHDLRTGEHFSEFGLNPAHHTQFIDLFRTRYRRATGKELRYYAVGEYGDETARPHFHYALYGYPTCLGPGPRWVNRKFHPCVCSNCRFVSDVWGKGHIFLGRLEYESAAYMAGYVTKKLTRAGNPRLGGRYPEFSRMSNKPGLGGLYIDRVFGTHGSKLQLDDLPRVFVTDGRLMPVGRYLKGRLSAKYFCPLPNKQETSRAFEASMFRVFVNPKTDASLREAYLLGSSNASCLKLLNSQRSLKLKLRHQRKRRFGSEI